MKSLIITLLLTLPLFLNNCANDPDFELEKRKIIDLLNRNADSYRMKDLDGIMSTYLNDSTAIALGTSRDFTGNGFENIRELFKKDLTQSWEMLTYEYKSPYIRVSGDVAWLTADLYSEVKVNIQGKEFDLKMDSRLTAVCKKFQNEWKFVLTNFQHFTSPEQALNKEMGKILDNAK
jgi:ketosteroid isomerase-like protein